jgi:hypothetical protein
MRRHGKKDAIKKDARQAVVVGSGPRMMGGRSRSNWRLMTLRILKERDHGFTMSLNKLLVADVGFLDETVRGSS